MLTLSDYRKGTTPNVKDTISLLFKKIHDTVAEYVL